MTTPEPFTVRPDRSRRVLLTDVCRATNALRTHIDRVVLREARLSWTAFDTLQVLCAENAVEPHMAARTVGVAKATMTAVISQLTGRSLVRRHSHPTDNRRIVLRPTLAGRELAHRLAARISAEETRLMATGSNTPPLAILRLFRTDPGTHHGVHSAPGGQANHPPMAGTPGTASGSEATIRRPASEHPQITR